MSCLGWLAHDPLETRTQLAAFMLPHARIAVCPGHHSLLLGFETRKLFKFRNREGNMHTDATRCGSQSHHASSDIGTRLCMPRCGQQMVSRMPRRRHIVRPGYALSADKFGIAIEGTCAKCGCAIAHYAYQATSELGGQADRLRRRCGARRPPRGQIVPMRGRPGRAGGRRAGLGLRDMQLPDEQLPYRGLCEGCGSMGFAPFGIGILIGLLTLTAYACCAADDDRD